MQLGREDEPGHFTAASSVLVVGAGVSGCACAAALAAEGVEVTVINSALDTVGLPAYSPELYSAPDAWAVVRESLGLLPAALRGAWLDAIAVPDNGMGLVVVDRRMVSVEAKRALERVPGLSFRQGLVVGLSLLPEGEMEPDVGGQGREGRAGGWSRGTRGKVLVETAFGEVLEGDAVVLAVGLSLGGHVAIGGDLLRGGRYGETPSDGLLAALEGLGAKWEEVAVEVGPRYRARRGAGCIAGEGSEANERRDGLWRAEATAVTMTQGGGGGDAPWSGSAVDSVSLRWSNEYPPSPHWTEGLRGREFVGWRTKNGEPVATALPDGIASGEICVPAEVGLCPTERDDAGSGCGGGSPATRLAQRIVGLRMLNIDNRGRALLGENKAAPVWVAGRVGGARGYLESLVSGVRVASSVLTSLGNVPVDTGSPWDGDEVDGEGGTVSWG